METNTTRFEENNERMDINGIQKVVPCVRDDLKPYIGREFKSIDDAFSFYNAYARLSGFSVRKGSQRCSTKESVAIWRVLMCSKEGQRDEKRDKQKKAKTRVGCEAKLEVRKKRDSSDYYVTKFIEEHNHMMMTPSKVYLLRSQRHMDEGAKRLIAKWSEAGLGTPNIMSILSTEAGGIRGIGFDEVQCRSYIQQIRRRTYGNDGQCLMNYFTKMQNQNSSFYFDVQIDAEGQICNCFWVDAQSRLDYVYFGDVVVFDTTYKTNKYLMPFAPFTGVNHHKQSILFGCALLVAETEDSFKWLFQTWLKAMNGNSPKAIITDQDPAMGAAIAKVFPDTQHRLCIWHILQKVPEKLGTVYRKYPTFKKDFSQCLYETDTVEEFESLWEKLIENYELQHDYDWLSYMYRIREKWCPIYFKDTFFAGMSTTQRSESMNKLFDGYVHIHTSLSEFVIQFEKAIENRRIKENKQDFKTVNETPNLRTSFSMEKQIAAMYTRKIFKQFQEEIWGSAGYLCKLILEDEIEAIYEVCNDSSTRNKVWTVSYKKSQENASCSCRKWEFEGILCRHVFSVFLRMCLTKFPEHYILKRWTPKAKDGLAYDVCGNEIQPNLEKSFTIRFTDLSYFANKCAQSGALYKRSYEFAKENLQKVLAEIKVLNDEESARNSSEEDTNFNVDMNGRPNGDVVSNSNESVVIRAPMKVHTKGSGKRIMKGIEVRVTKQRTCHSCGVLGHNIRTCPNLK